MSSILDAWMLFIFIFFFPHPIRSVIASVFIQLTEKDDINVLLLEDKA